MHVVLYYAPITCALAPYITLTEAGAKFEVRSLNLRKDQQHSPEYLKLNRAQGAGPYRGRQIYGERGNSNLDRS